MKTKNFSLVMCLLLTFATQVNAQSNMGYMSQSVNDFSKTIQSKNVTLIDVRTTQEFDAGHIKGAINIDMHDPEFVNKVLKVAKNKEVALYCRSGHRSKLAAEALSGKVKKIYELMSGFNGWLAAQKPVSN